jgi:predicted CXXCH cytochrome family protein
VVLFFVGCRGSNGNDGTAGTAGPGGDAGTQGPSGDGGTGPIGPTGPSGDAGAAGATGGSGAEGQPGGTPTTRTTLFPWESLPGVIIAIVDGGVVGDAGAAIQVGDKPSVSFTVKRNDGTSLPLSELDYGRIWISGPTSNIQRVIASQSDLRTKSVQDDAGVYTYTFATAIPTTYLAPYNDGPLIDAGELTGTALQAGTYTAVIIAYKNFTYDGVYERDADVTIPTVFKDVANATQEFRMQSAGSIEKRDVVRTANCEQCHVNLRAHGGSRTEVETCITCHTAGMEDKLDAGNTLEFGVMIHRIHNAKHLPSVNGVGVGANGVRNFDAGKRPYMINSDDFSEVGFPVWPNLNIAMPAEPGYGAWDAGEKSQSDEIRRGVTACAKCHGDLSGGWTDAGPTQGQNAFTKPTRRICGSCHDDINWGVAYPAKRGTFAMPLQPNDSACAACHIPSGYAMFGSVQDSHIHPVLNPAMNGGLNVKILSVTEFDGGNGNGKIDPGERIRVSFTMVDDADAGVTGALLGTNVSVALAGPTTNYNLVLNASIHKDVLDGGQPYAVNLPEPVMFERLGAPTFGDAGEVLTSPRKPIWMAGTAPTVYQRTGEGSTNYLGAAATAGQNYVDLVNIGDFSHHDGGQGDFVVIDDPAHDGGGGGALKEYRQIAFVEDGGTRIWFYTTGSYGYKAGLRFLHSAGASVHKVFFTKRTSNTHYTVDGPNGTITEVGDALDGGEVVMNYTTDFVMPSVYPEAINESPDIGAEWGKWAKLPIVDGTYSLGLWSYRNVYVGTDGGVQTSAPTGSSTVTYRGTSPAANYDFGVGDAGATTAYAIISGAGSTCNACHNDLFFHGGGRRGYDTCKLCHSTAGSEDRPKYTAPNAPATTAETINFRRMLHRIHAGKELANATTYAIVGYSSTAWPDNYGSSTFDEIGFPSWPDGVKDCAKCHGTSIAWAQPTDRTHPTAQPATKPLRGYQVACGSCHDSAAAAAHINLQTDNGTETCTLCHAPGRDFGVDMMHKIRPR